MARPRYARCYLCRGRVAERWLVVDYRRGKNLLAIIEDVPVGVCETCGERYFRCAVVRAMESTAHSRHRTRLVVAVPVRRLPSRLKTAQGRRERHNRATTAA